MVCVCKCNTASQRSAVRFSGYKHRLVTFEGKYVSELGDEYRKKFSLEFFSR